MSLEIRDATLERRDESLATRHWYRKALSLLCHPIVYCLLLRRGDPGGATADDAVVVDTC